MQVKDPAGKLDLEVTGRTLTVANVPNIAAAEDMDALQAPERWRTGCRQQDAT